MRGTIDEPFKVEINGLLELKPKGPIDVADQTITIQPGGHTGWHSHPGPALVVIKSGRFTLYDGDDPNCAPQVFEEGSAFVDRGGGHVHIGRNEGATAVEPSVTYLLPVGAGPRTDVTPAPGNCRFLTVPGSPTQLRPADSVMRRERDRPRSRLGCRLRSVDVRSGSGKR